MDSNGFQIGFSNVLVDLRRTEAAVLDRYMAREAAAPRSGDMMGLV
jgi:hypothetical protein